ncbi:nucleoside monophosphate kinase [Candidatus Dojkabacteria bacterium]|uniref:Nucleoside monophosphate kinase n=1 Tax=Candidatus Dojkabacteria bacterium TaxID=2099670 RepID=A0A955I8E5_9BACT|nr:nucleoside monophosphate kinase [Candidatus Dojkabacteria bacterium]
MQPIIINLFGLPGVGKSTLAHQLASEFDFHVISTGEILRACFTENIPNPYSQRYSSILKPFETNYRNGEHLPDDLMTSILVGELTFNLDKSSSFILPGSIKTIRQAKDFDTRVRELGLNIRMLNIHLICDDKTLVTRIEQRHKLENRPDGLNGLNLLDGFRITNNELVDYYNSGEGLVTLNTESREPMELAVDVSRIIEIKRVGEELPVDFINNK